MKNKLIGFGAGGHSKVILDIIKIRNEYSILGLIDKNYKKIKKIGQIPVLGDDKKLIYYFNKGIRNIYIGVSDIKESTKNKKIFNYLYKIGFNVINIIHPTSIISSKSKIGIGCRFFAGSIVNPNVVIGNNVLINTGTIIEHDCKISDHVQIGPGTNLAGEVEVGEGTIIGIGVNIINKIKIGKYSYIAAGSVVTRNVKNNTLVAGTPAVEVKKC